MSGDNGTESGPNVPTSTVIASPDAASKPGPNHRITFEASDPASDAASAEAGPSRLSPSCSGDQPGGVTERTPVVNPVPLPDDVDVQEEFYDLKMAWSGKVYNLRVGANDMVYDFRQKIAESTNVPPERQKVIGLSKGKLSAEMDSVRFGTLGVKTGIKFTLIGTPEADSFKDWPKDLIGPATDDFDVKYTIQPEPMARAVAPADDSRNKRKIREVIRRCPITVMNEPRPGKRLLVLDLDYTILDTKPLLEGSLPADECARPGLHQFLEKVYPHYDIVVWSQTHWRWLESKLVEIGMIGGDRNYRISFVADSTSMFPIFTQRNGQAFKHEVKPLAYFWAKFPQWSAKNTIHIDDLSRNFALNPGEGLKIRAFKAAGTPDGVSDRELLKLGTYLLGLAERCEDFTTVDHTRWKHALSQPTPNPP